jgi:hypothetical protein
MRLLEGGSHDIDNLLGISQDVEPGYKGSSTLGGARK